jgi:hypothetical protein
VSKQGKERLVSGRWAAVYTAKTAEPCSGCSRMIAAGEQFVVSRTRRKSGRIERVIYCVENCEPLDDEEPNTPVGNALRLKKLAGSHAPCGYCGKEKLSSRLRQKIDPKSFKVVHEMILCNDCADGSGYTIPAQSRNTNLMDKTQSMPRL